MRPEVSNGDNIIQMGQSVVNNNMCLEGRKGGWATRKKAAQEEDMLASAKDAQDAP